MQTYSASTPATPQSFQFNLQKQNPKHFRIIAVTQKIIRESTSTGRKQDARCYTFFVYASRDAFPLMNLICSLTWIPVWYQGTE